MLVRSLRPAAAPLLLAFVLGACSDATSPTAVGTSPAGEAPTLAASAAQVLTYSAKLEGTILVPPGDVVTQCLGEPIEVHYRGQFRVMLQQNGSGERSLASVHMNDMGSSAVGLESGTAYRLVGSSIDKTTDGAGGYGNGATTWRTAGQQKYVGPGGRGFTARSSYALTLGPDGTLRAERLASTIECR
jgi:hypothetical protein